MVREDLILRKTRLLLDEFLAPMQDQVDKPRKRFLEGAEKQHCLELGLPWEGGDSIDDYT